MKELQRVFSYNNYSVRTVLEGGEPRFVAKDVCEVLDLGDVSRAVGRLDEDEKGTISIRTPGGTQMMLVVNEPGLYSLILGSRKPEARAFKRWVVHEVLPAIRKTGAYDVRMPQSFPEALRLLADTEEQRERLEAENQLMKPKVELYDRALAAGNTMSVGDVAKCFKWGRNRLFDFLRDQDVLADDNLPYQRYIERDYFQVRLVPIKVGQEEKNVAQTMVTAKGMDFIGRLLTTIDKVVV